MIPDEIHGAPTVRQALPQAPYIPFTWISRIVGRVLLKFLKEVNIAAMTKNRNSKEKTLYDEHTTSKPQTLYTSSICSKYEKCNAPLCPMDPSSLDNCVWYANEDICSNPSFKNELWIQNQKKISKAYRLKPFTGYFTHRMLERKFIVRRGIKGIDPDGQEDPQLARWLRDHPELSEEQIGSLKKRGKEYGFKKAYQG